MDAPGGVLSAQMAEPIRVTGKLSPKAISEPKPGMYIFDMGQNMVGWCRLKVVGPAGSAVKLRFAETLKDDGTLYLANIRGAEVTDVLAVVALRGKAAGKSATRPAGCLGVEKPGRCILL